MTDNGYGETPPAQHQQTLPEPTVYVRELYPGVVAKGMGLPPGEWAHFRIQVTQRGADLDIKLKRTFGGAPAVLLTFGDLPDQARTDEEINAERNEKSGQDAGDVTTLVVPWREVCTPPHPRFLNIASSTSGVVCIDQGGGILHLHMQREHALEFSVVTLGGNPGDSQLLTGMGAPDRYIWQQTDR